MQAHQVRTSAKLALNAIRDRYQKSADLPSPDEVHAMLEFVRASFGGQAGRTQLVPAATKMSR
jgi:hypothetical protein